MKSINVEEAQQWSLSNKAVIVDVREPAEIASIRVKEMIAAPLSQSSLIKHPIDEDKAIIVLCRSGNRSRQACKLIQQQFPNHQVYNLEGGIQAWEASGFPLIKGKHYHLALDRQVQLTIGSMVLLASILGFFITPWFFLLSGFFGGGLIFAGLSGTCGLALLLAKMPWNQTNK